MHSFVVYMVLFFLAFLIPQIEKDKKKSTPEIALNLCKPTHVKVVGASETTEHSTEFSVLRMGR